jgi:hypothetical protein
MSRMRSSRRPSRAGAKLTSVGCGVDEVAEHVQLGPVVVRRQLQRRDHVDGAGGRGLRSRHAADGVVVGQRDDVQPPARAA